MKVPWQQQTDDLAEATAYSALPLDRLVGLDGVERLESTVRPMTAPEGSLYGWRHADLRSAAAQVAEALSIELDLRDSLFRGGDYYRWRGPDDEELFIQENFRDFQGELEWPEHAEYPVMLDVGGRLSDRGYEVLAALPGLHLLEVRLPLNPLRSRPPSDPSQEAT